MEDELEEIQKLAETPECREMTNKTLLFAIYNGYDSFELHPSGKRIILYNGDIEDERKPLKPFHKDLYDLVIIRFETMADLDSRINEPQENRYSLHCFDQDFNLKVYTEALKDGKFLRCEIIRQ